MNAFLRRQCRHTALFVSAFVIVVALACHLTSVVAAAATSDNREIYVADSSGGSVLRFSRNRKTFNSSQRREFSFFGKAATFTISGQVKESFGGGGFGRESTITLANSSGETRSVKADADGRYSFANLTAGDRYTVSISTVDGIYLIPEGSTTVENLNANREINFVRAARFDFYVKDNESPLPGVAIRVAVSDPATPTSCPTVFPTNEIGRISFCYLAVGGSYIITPSKSLYKFDPAQLVLDRLTVFDAPFTVVNFTATPQVSPELRTWTIDGTTYGYVKLLFGGNSLRVADWGQATRTGDDFTATPRLERVPLTVGEPNTNAHIYDFGKLPNGNYNFTFNSSENVTLTRAFTVSDAPAAANPIDDAQEFVRQQYRDFLAREPDAPGLDFWTREITSCGSDAQCIDRQRANVSASFFLSQEFQATGYYVYLLYKGGLGRAPYYSEFVADVRKVTVGIVVDNRLSPEVIDRNKQDFAREFVARTEFRSRHLSSATTTYVDALFRLTGSTPTTTERDALIADAGGASVNSFEQLATVLYKIVDGTTSQQDGVGVKSIFNTRYGREFYDREFNRAFVQMQYFGYLQRDPDAEGYQFWLDKLNRFGNFTDAELVRAFVLAAEYRTRFGRP